MPGTHYDQAEDVQATVVGGGFDCSRSYMIRSVAHGTVMNFNGHNIEVVHMPAFDDDCRTHREFKFASITPGYYVIRSVVHGTVMNFNGCDAKVVHMPWDGNCKTHKEFEFMSTEDGHYVIKNRAHGTVMNFNGHNVEVVHMPAFDDACRTHREFDIIPVDLAGDIAG